MTAAARAKLTGAWRAVQVIGLGSVIALIIIPRLVQQGEQKDTFIQQQFVDKVDKNTQAITTQTEVTRQQIDTGNRVVDSLNELCESHKDLCKETAQQGQRIERLMGKLWQEQAGVPQGTK